MVKTSQSDSNLKAHRSNSTPPPSPVRKAVQLQKPPSIKALRLAKARRRRQHGNTATTRTLFQGAHDDALVAQLAGVNLV